MRSLVHNPVMSTTSFIHWNDVQYRPVTLGVIWPRNPRIPISGINDPRHYNGHLVNTIWQRHVWSNELTRQSIVWLGSSSRYANRPYMTALKALLGVRATTTNSICLLELGLPSLEARVKAAQNKILTDILSKREGMKDDTFMLVWNICRNANTRGYRYLKTIIDDGDPIQSDIASLRHEVGSSTRTKPRTYVLLNPDLSVSPVYGRTSVPEYQGIALSRFRVSSHNLAIETGRWSRTPRERKLCPCGMV